MVLPTPDYDSGWQFGSLAGPAQGQPKEITLQHNLGTTDLLVQIVGLLPVPSSPETVCASGNSWTLTASEITITVKQFGVQFRVMLWKIQLKISPP